MTNGVGKKIKKVRELKNISLEELAERTDLDTEQIVNIEEMELAPSLGPLIKIARGLGVRLGTFLDDQENLGPVVTKSNQKIKGMSFSNGVSEARAHLDFFTLASGKTGRHMEPFIVDIEPSINSDYKLSSHEGEEFIYVLEGEVEINYGKQVYNIKEGDSIYYDSIVAHNVHAGSDKAAKILAVIYTPL
ncbi:MAG: cupin domain-containing protein [Bacteroidota bacterium]|nr:cupin domain-containing protein [Bacteroidota bacterium]MDP4206806.1 cupin domain-containing protein [Bacteroidota bacterium]